MTFTIFNRSNRAAGAYLSSVAQIPEGLYSLGISSDMTDATASDPSLSARFAIRLSQDGVDWTGPLSREVFIVEWNGGTHPAKGTGALVPNHFRMAWSDNDLAAGAFLNWWARAEIVLDARFSIGIDAVAYPEGTDF